MPELPEVETVKNGLTPFLKGRKVQEVTLRRDRLRFDIPAHLRQDMQGDIVDHLSRRGKYILIHMQRGFSVIVHLGMSGSFRVGAASEILPYQKHDHVVLGLGEDILAVYNDPRRFGFFDVIDGWDADAYPSLAKMGPEPLSDDLNATYLYHRLQDVSSPIKTALLNQDIVAGLGNIYVCEALYRAGIHPKRKAHKIGFERCDALTMHIKDVLHEAIDAGGSSLQDHKNVDGALGYFQHRFSVYDREGEYCPLASCREKGAPCVRRIVQAGRSSFYCVNTQR